MSKQREAKREKRICNNFEQWIDKALRATPVEWWKNFQRYQRITKRKVGHVSKSR